MYKDKVKRKACWVEASRRYQKWWHDWKEEQGFKCEVCGYDKHPAAIQFHHTDRKPVDMDVAQLVKLHRKIDIIMAEIKKCRVLCANCHAIEHAKVRK